VNESLIDERSESIGESTILAAINSGEQPVAHSISYLVSIEPSDEQVS